MGALPQLALFTSEHVIILYILWPSWGNKEHLDLVLIGTVDNFKSRCVIKGLGFDSRLGPFCFELHVLPVSVWDISGYSHSPKIIQRHACEVNWVNWVFLIVHRCKCEHVWLFLNVSRAVNCWLIQGVPCFCSKSVEIGHRPSPHPPLWPFVGWINVSHTIQPLLFS